MPAVVRTQRIILPPVIALFFIGLFRFYAFIAAASVIVVSPGRAVPTVPVTWRYP